MIEAQFQQLAEQTEQLLRLFRQSPPVDFNEADRRFEARERLLADLNEQLRGCANIEVYRDLFESWQRFESELNGQIRQSLLETANKINKLKHARNASDQYNSYMRQMPYGAFLDQKK
ncbi:hypothetical protein [Paenibacillus humicola]|uniref:hypothetical protein n=1 Tax=Paenibacillus humicola TaxID=3110540 RepID=UPI00237AAB68|nr:hypothetical protein [Paenibacillus humicola]